MDNSSTDDAPGGSAGPKAAHVVLSPGKVSLFARLRAYFLTGIIVTAPLSITFYLAWLFIAWVDDKVTPLIPHRYNPETYLPFGLPGLGLIVVVIFLTFIGFITATLLGRTIISIGERLLNRMPVIRTIYGSLKQILETVLQHSSTSFRQVVLVQYPRPGIWKLAFVTSETTGEVQRATDDEAVNVFLPKAPNPTNGYLMVVPARDLIYLDMTPEQAAKMIISCGVIMPPDDLTVPQEGEPQPSALPQRSAEVAGS